MQSSKARTTRRLRFTTGPGVLRRLTRHLRTVLVLMVRGPEARALLLLAIEEAATNILEHGYKFEAGRPIEVLVRPLCQDRFDIVLKDRAPTVDTAALVPGDLRELAKRHAPRGRGIAMVHQLTEAIQHQPRGGGGNILTLTVSTTRLTRIAEEHSRDVA